AEIRVDGARPSDHAKPLVAQARDGEVGDDAAPVVQELRVDDRTGRTVDPVVGNALEQGKGARPRDLDLSEGRHVDDPDALAERAMLLRDEVEIRRCRPAELALIGARAPPGLAGTEIVGPLPAVLRAEDRAQLLEAPVQRAEPLRPPPLVGVERITKAVVVAVDLARGGGREVRVAIRAAEAPGTVALDVELRLAGRDQLRRGLPHPACAAEAVQR